MTRAEVLAKCLHFLSPEDPDAYALDYSSIGYGGDVSRRVEPGGRTHVPAGDKSIVKTQSYGEGGGHSEDDPILAWAVERADLGRALDSLDPFLAAAGNARRKYFGVRGVLRALRTNYRHQWAEWSAKHRGDDGLALGALMGLCAERMAEKLGEWA